MTDLLVVSVPVLDLQYPPSSPAIIKSCAIAAGYTAHTMDLNLLLRDLCVSTREFLEVHTSFENIGGDVVNNDNIVDIFFNSHTTVVKDWLDKSVKAIADHSPKWLGVSVFSYKSHKATLILCAEIKRQYPNIKIVLGGRGATSFALGPDHAKFSKKLIEYFGYRVDKNFGNSLIEYSLADAVIHGDGEQAIVDLLSGSLSNTSEINADISAINLETLPFVDFDDYDLAAYEYINEPTLPITGSKGCVRKCTFCDIPVLWPKFKFRSGEHIAKEMIHLYSKYGVKKFYMSDSLVNGSMKAFKDFITVLSEFNEKNNVQLKWVGQYITRPVSNELDEDYYRLLKKSGGEGLTIGVESGSDAVRAHMKKNFKTIDIDTELAYFDKHSIVCVLLFFSCYPTETWIDFLDTVNMFIRYQKYCASGTVYKITLGTPYTHHQQTPLWNMREDIGLESKKGSDILWLLKENPTLTFKERVRRRLILQEVATALKLPMSRNAAELNQIISSLELHNNDIDEYFGVEPAAALYKDRYNLLGTSPILMPYDLQYTIKTHIDAHPEYIVKILELHQNTNDDISFNNNAYNTLKSLIT